MLLKYSKSSFYTWAPMKCCFIFEYSDLIFDVVLLWDFFFFPKRLGQSQGHIFID